MLEEVHELAVEDKVPRIFLLEHLRQQSGERDLANGRTARTRITVSQAGTPHPAPSGAVTTVAALQFRSRGNEIRAFARDQHDFVIAGR